MPIIFGWGHTNSKEEGIVFKERCPHCNNETNFLLYVIKTYFTFFFIPIIPYSIKKLIACSICNFSYEVEDNDYLTLKELTKVHAKYNSGLISEDEYNKLLNEISNPNKI